MAKMAATAPAKPRGARLLIAAFGVWEAPAPDPVAEPAGLGEDLELGEGKLSS